MSDYSRGWTTMGSSSGDAAFSLAIPTVVLQWDRAARRRCLLIDDSHCLDMMASTRAGDAAFSQTM